ncbi:hypothetical protein EIP91_004892 [Steccherinum ochraceum]|uniref:Uncharacterized protein n=1 Tax=Steccherinum ochraceum TaxID=92696 RepID=A0A4R0R819_9APHY|nr:hypothetical protein EIP91_004892 [Steccherinum ochraceum]
MVLDFTKYSDAEVAQAVALGRFPAADGLRLEFLHYSVLRLALQIRARPAMEESGLAEMDRILHGNREFLAILRRNAGDAAFPATMEAFIRWGDRDRGVVEPPYRSFEDFLAREVGGSLMAGYPYDALRMYWDHATFRVPAPEDVYGWGLPTTPPPTPAVPAADLPEAEVSSGPTIEEYEAWVGNGGVTDGERDSGEEGTESERDELESEKGEERERDDAGNGSEDEVDRLFGQLAVGGEVSSPGLEGAWRYSPDFSLPERSGEPLFLPDPSDADGLTPFRRSVTPSDSWRFDETDVPASPQPRPRLRRNAGMVRVDSPFVEAELGSPRVAAEIPALGARRLRLLPPRPESSQASSSAAAPVVSRGSRRVASSSRLPPPLPTPSTSTGSVAGSVEAEFVYNGLLGPMGPSTPGSQGGLDNDADQGEAEEEMSEEERRAARRMGKRKAE